MRLGPATAVLLALWGAALPASWGNTEELAPGLLGKYFQLGGPLERFPEIPEGRSPDLCRVDRGIRFEATAEGFAGTKFQNYFFVRWIGFLRAPRKGKYLFYLASDDGSRLFVAGKLVVDNGGLHAMQEGDGSIELDPGDHPFQVDFFNNSGPGGCIASWQPPEGKKEVIPEGVFFHRPRPTPPEKTLPQAAPGGKKPLEGPVAAARAGPAPAGGERPPDLSGRVEGVFRDDPLALLVIRKGGSEIPVYTDQTTRITYAGILREGRRPTVGYMAHIWLRPGDPDTAEAVRFEPARR